MAEEQEKTEQATGRRREKAREQGQIPQSREIVGIMPVWVVFLYLSFGGFMFTMLTSYLKMALKRGFEVSLTDASFVTVFRTDAIKTLFMMTPFFATLLVAVMTVGFLQTGFLITTQPMTPDISRINPLKGIKKFFSLNIFFEAAKGIFKVMILGLVLYNLLKKETVTVPLLIDMDISSIAQFAYVQVKKLVLTSVIVLSIFAVADYAYQRWKFLRDLRMTKQEVKEEHKEMEGDPRIKARIRSLQREMARKRMMQEVPKADVVITNPTHYAVALKYDSASMGAPAVTAKGANIIAEKIKEIAKTHGVPVFEDKLLARSLYKLDINQEIPEVFYKALAAILANVYKLKGKVG
ncbi:MAG: flagellar biosynthesis protein FlhB [Nitrospirae bacterium]|nr:flagellar biosynthesis protein FlhB [Nitrospirota bacterium]